jgi:hypothetical protein
MLLRITPIEPAKKVAVLPKRSQGFFKRKHLFLYILFAVYSQERLYPHL